MRLVPRNHMNRPQRGIRRLSGKRHHSRRRLPHTVRLAARRSIRGARVHNPGRVRGSTNLEVVILMHTAGLSPATLGSMMGNWKSPHF